VSAPVPDAPAGTASAGTASAGTASAGTASAGTASAGTASAAAPAGGPAAPAPARELRLPQGFRFSGVHSGVKAARKDLALVASDVPCVAAGCFTRNLARAAPLQDAAARLPAGGVRAVLVNSGIANALTGAQGLADVAALHAAAGRELGVPPGAVLSLSTGVIGQRLPVERLAAALPRLVAGLAPEPDAAADAILTTDTRRKLASRTLTLGGREVTVAALAKGSGMVHPSLATVLAVVVTDAAVRPAALASALQGAMGPSFNSLTVDGDMSPNDAVLALANGLAGNAPVEGPGADYDALAGALGGLCQELARMVAADGEGATKLLEVRVTGAPDAEVARDLARAVAGSALVKAAVFGADPNWGRVLATVGARAGTQGYPVDPHRSRVAIQGLPVYDAGPVSPDAAALRSRMRAPEVGVEVELRAGAGEAVAWGCDLSYDYVKLNADYTSLLVASPDGRVARDDRLTNYSPAFKTTLLVEALSYISRFSNKRCVIKYGGAAMVKPALKESFCRDIELLRSVGLRPVVVHGGGEEMRRAMAKMGGSAEERGDDGGVRLPSGEDARVMEMVLTGSVNTELVTLLNRHGSHAVGVSGKDGALLRARRREDAQGGHVGELAHLNGAFLEMLLGQGYVPVISPVGLGEDGQSYPLSGDAVAAEVARAVGASKLIYLTNVAGLLDGELLVQDLTAPELASRLEGGSITGGMRTKARTVLHALEGGVEKAHIIDGRMPHSLIAELFTDRGVGTLVTPGPRAPAPAPAPGGGA
jgi:acetylglutamate kinase